MKEIMKTYGAAILTVVAAVLFFVTLLFYFDQGSGFIKNIHDSYLDRICCIGQIRC